MSYESSNRMPFDEGSFLDVGNPDLMQRIAQDIHTGWATKALLSQMEFKKQAAAAAKVEHCAREWCTEDFIETTPESYWYWVGRLGHQCWADNEFRAQYLRDNPECRRRVKTGHTVITAGTPWQTEHAVRAGLNTAKRMAA